MHEEEHQAMGKRHAISTDSAASETGRRSYAAGRVAFLSVLSEVAKDVRAGIPVKHVYCAHMERLAGIGYRQFARYVKHYVTDGRERESRAVHGQRKALSPASACPSGPLLPTIERRRGFDYRAEDAAKKENLV